MYVIGNLSCDLFFLCCIDFAIETLIKHDEIVAIVEKFHVQFFMLTIRLLLKVRLCNPMCKLIKIRNLIRDAASERIFYRTYIGWNEDNDFIDDFNFVISVRCIQIVIAIFSEKCNDGYNYNANSHIPFRIA